MKRLVVCLLLFLLTPSTNAEVHIRIADRLPNLGKGYCVWCCLETMGRYRHDSRLYGLVNHQVDKTWPNGGATQDDIRTYLDSLGVKYHMLWNGSLSWLKQWTDAEQPVMIWVRPSKNMDQNAFHAVIAVDVSGQWIKTVDSNYVKGYMWWHESSWIGFAVTLD